jgi:hypothetical protein
MLLQAESFDLYGTTIANLGQVGYTIGGSSTLVTSATARTGPSYISFPSSLSGIQWAITNPTRVTGQGCGMYVNSMPGSGGNIPYDQGLWWTLNNTAVNKISIMPNIFKGFNIYLNATLVGITPNNLWVPGSWFWVEGKVTTNSGTNTNDSSIEFRFQGGSGFPGGSTTIVNGLNFNGNMGFFGIGNNPNSNGDASRLFCDDWVMWDNTGTRNNDFLGDRRCFARLEAANAPTQNWLFTGGATAWQSISNVPPNAAQYISSSTVGDISEFTGVPLGIQSNDIAAVVMRAANLKTDAGACSFRLGMNSAGNVLNGPSHAPGTSQSFATDIFELDPNGNIQWTMAAVDAALRRVTRDS